MNFIAIFLAVLGLVVGAFYALESFLFFRSNGFALPLLFKVGLSALGFYFFVRNLRRIKKTSAAGAA